MKPAVVGEARRVGAVDPPRLRRRDCARHARRGIRRGSGQRRRTWRVTAQAALFAGVRARAGLLVRVESAAARAGPRRAIEFALSADRGPRRAPPVEPRQRPSKSNPPSVEHADRAKRRPRRAPAEVESAAVTRAPANVRPRHALRREVESAGGDTPATVAKSNPPAVTTPANIATPRPGDHARDRREVESACGEHARERCEVAAPAVTRPRPSRVESAGDTPATVAKSTACGVMPTVCEVESAAVTTPATVAKSNPPAVTTPANIGKPTPPAATRPRPGEVGSTCGERTGEESESNAEGPEVESLERASDAAGDHPGQARESHRGPRTPRPGCRPPGRGPRTPIPGARH